MSSFTNYESSAAENYDVTRIPIGIELYEGAIRQYAPSDFNNALLLDLGSGTGSYAKKLLDQGLGHCTLADAANKMIEKSTEKVKKYINEYSTIVERDYDFDLKEDGGTTTPTGGGTSRIIASESNDKNKEIKETSITTAFRKRARVIKVLLPSIPLSDEAYDVVSLNMVIHHLVRTSPEDNLVHDWSPIIDTFKECGRVLKPKGVLLIGYSTPNQRGGNWYAKLVPNSRKRIMAKCPTSHQVADFCTKAKFKIVGEYSMMMHYVGTSTYYNPTFFVENPGAWYMDSVLSGASSDELDKAKNAVQKMHSEGRLNEFMQMHDELPKFGCGRIVIAIKEE